MHAAMLLGLGSPDPGHTSDCHRLGWTMSYLHPSPDSHPSNRPQFFPMVMAELAPILGAGRLPRASTTALMLSDEQPSSQHALSSQPLNALKSRSFPVCGSLVDETREPSPRRRTAAPCFPGSMPKCSLEGDVVVIAKPCSWCSGGAELIVNDLVEVEVRVSAGRGLLAHPNLLPHKGGDD